MTTCEHNYTRTAEHERLAAQVNAFLASGGQIEHIPRGAMAETGWSPQKRLDRAGPQIRQRAEVEHHERQARKKAVRGLPAPKPTTQPKAPVVRFAPPGSQKARILSLLADGPRSVADLASAIGTTRQVIAVGMADLRKRGLVTSQGQRHRMRFVRVMPDGDES